MSDELLHSDICHLLMIYGVGENIATDIFCVNLTVATVNFLKSLKWYVTVCFLGLFVNGRYHTACRYSGPMVWNSASVTFLKICYYGRQWDLIWCNDTYRELVRWDTLVINLVRVPDVQSFLCSMLPRLSNFRNIPHMTRCLGTNIWSCLMQGRMKSVPLALESNSRYFASNIELSGSSVVRPFAHGAMGRQVDPSWGGHIELFLIPASAPRLV